MNAKLLAAKVFRVSSVLATVTAAEVGASLVLDTTMSKSSVTAAELPSVQVTLTDAVPTAPLSGVPLNVRDPALKESQLSESVASAAPLVSAAVYVHESPVSASAKASVPNWYDRAASSLTAWFDTP